MSKKLRKRIESLGVFLLGVCLSGVGWHDSARAEPPLPSDYEAYPPFLEVSVPPLVMLVMGRDHKLYYEAYNDASDLNEDGVLDTVYKPDEIDYYGYFDSFKYYQYNAAATPPRFEPRGLAPDKKAPDGDYWSGDFLNYLTMSRMDAMRKVLYGGYRRVDTATETVLERAYIPQDAHSWGKEYTSIAYDGYDIREYTPHNLPYPGTRHLYASTSIVDFSDANYAPLLRIMTNNPHRIWEWVAKERAVVDDSLETTGGSSWQIVPASITNGISGMTRATYNLGSSHSYPDNYSEFEALHNYALAVPSRKYGEGSAYTIDGSGNPYGSDDYYLTVFRGTLNIPADGEYEFAVDGDDAVEFIIDIDNDGVFEESEVVAHYYGAHGTCNCNTNNGTIDLDAGAYQFQFRHEEYAGGDTYYLRWNPGAVPASTIVDYHVRVTVADSSVGVEPNTKEYPNGNYKPVGLLQRHGENDDMYFGLISGSYTKNTSGGVLRKKIGSITDEIDADTGQFTSTNGIIRTIDTFRIVDFRYNPSSPSTSYDYYVNCGWITTHPIEEGQCRMWGNPIGEMMYESLRYFSGAGAPTSAFTYAGDYDNRLNNAGTSLALPKATWNDPYDPEDGGFEYCAKPFMLILSDINPSFDSDQLPGVHSEFGSMAPQTLGEATIPLNVEELADAIFSGDELNAGDKFIGHRDTLYDGACTAKSVDGFGDIRGLCPEEPTKQGSYYSAAVAYYGWTEDINLVEGVQKVRTYAVGLASPLPQIEIPIKGKTITMVPFGKSVRGSGIDGDEGEFQPTNTIVDFFVEEIHPHYGRFRINFEDVEQGADHDMDAIVIYEYQLVDENGLPVTEATVDNAESLEITLTSEYAAGGIVQHMGYVISGTTNDGIYLEVRDLDTDADTEDRSYFLDTPSDAWVAAGHIGLPLSNTREFFVDPEGGSLAAGLLPNPLWYAAKWGSFEDRNDNGIPDLDEEWDKDGDGVPDTYFYVVNPLKLEEQLNRSFADILEKAASGTAASVLATNSEGEGHLLQAYFRPTVNTASGNQLSWLGYLQSLWVDPWGNLREDSNGNGRLDLMNEIESVTATGAVDKIIEYSTDINNDVIVKRFINHFHYHPGNGMNETCQLGELDPPVECPDLASSASFEIVLMDEISPIFEAGQKLRQRYAENRKIFTFLDGNGLDDDSDGVIDESGEVESADTKWVGRVVAPFTDDPFDNNGELIQFTEANWQRLQPFLGVGHADAWAYLDDAATPSHETRTRNLINYVRGKDSVDLIGNPPTRNRSLDDGTVWKLGDIVNSTPVSISRPPESYHIIYSDESFQNYLDAYRDRETIVYVGANDGMIHAFTSWNYDEDTGEYTQPTSTTEGLGDELWAYIPQSLLPHLKFLANPDYRHAFYVDGKPKVFDAQIFPDGTYGTSDGKLDWGTLMIVGFNMGGKAIEAVGDFDQNSTTADVTRGFRPSYVCFDITEPRSPKVLWERSYDQLAMTSAFPAVLAVGKTRSISSGTYSWSEGQWFVTFGSGPTDYDGRSDQNGYIFVVDLLTGEPMRNTASDEDWLFDTGISHTVMNSPVSFDKNLTYNVDAIYYGTVTETLLSGIPTGELEGNLFKINTRSGSSPTTNTDHWRLWKMFNAPGPISASVSLSTDRRDNVWIYFGTGRYLSNEDSVDESQQYFFGIKDPYFNRDYYNTTPNYYFNDTTAKEILWDDDPALNDLFYANPYNVHTNRLVTDGASGVMEWRDLLDEARTYDGWYRELETTTDLPSERVITKPSVLGGIVFFPAYTPNDDVCGFGGSTNFYGLYYETGTAYFKHILPGSIDTATVDGEETEVVNYKLDVGYGAPPPAIGIHTGREGGATAYLQMSTGEVVGVEVETALPLKSGITAWRDKNR